MKKVKKEQNISSFCVHTPLMTELEKAKYEEKLKQEYNIENSKPKKDIKK